MSQADTDTLSITIVTNMLMLFSRIVQFEKNRIPRYDN